MSEIFDSRNCFLGEGPFWHPQREQLFWFDIINCRLLSRKGEQVFEWNFEVSVSACGWINSEQLLIAAENALLVFDVNTGNSSELIALEADNTLTRSNDGRADPFGGFWVGTMGKKAEPEAGAIYRYFRGELRRLHARITIPNSICFSPDGSRAYFADTSRQIIWTQKLGTNGWPDAEPEIFLDLTGKDLYPDGSVVDVDGDLWNAQWGSGSVARYSQKGEFLERVYVSGVHSSCPAFGGSGFDTLYVTTAQEGIELPSTADGVVYQVKAAATGQPEPQIIL